MDFTQWLQNELNAREWSNAEIARRSGMSRARFTQVFGGDDPSATFCVAIASALGLPTIDVLKRAGFDVIKSPPELDDPWLAECWAVIQRVPPEHRATVMVMLRSLVDP